MFRIRVVAAVAIALLSCSLRAQWLVPPSYTVTPFTTASAAVDDASGDEGSVIPICVAAPSSSWATSTMYLSAHQTESTGTATIETSSGNSLPPQDSYTTLCHTILSSYAAHNFPSYAAARVSYDSLSSLVKATAYILKTNAGNAPYVVVSQESNTLCI